MAVKELTKKNYVVLVDNEGKDILPVTDGKAVFVGDGSQKLNDKLTAIDGAVSSNASEVTRVESELNGKISTVEGRVATLESGKADKTQVAQDIATAKQELQTKIDLKANIADLGTAAYKNIGNAEGNIPVLGANGKLDESMIPAIAINEHFDAESQEQAMLLSMQNGDMVFIGTEGVGTTYICVNVSESTFEKRFRPLNSVADAITRGEVESKLANKVDNSAFESYKGEVTTELNKKALASEVGVVSGLQTTAKVVVGAINEVKAVADGAEAKATKNASDLASYKVEVQGKLDTKVEIADFNSYKGEVTTALDGKANAQHVHDEYALKSEMGAVSGLTTTAKNTIVDAINEVKKGVNANASAIATKVETTVFEQYKTDAKGITDSLASRVQANESAIAGLAGAIKFRVFNIDEEDLTTQA